MKKMWMYMVAVGCGLAMIGGQAKAQSDADKKFVTEAAQGNLVEERLAQLALKTSKNPQVLDFAHKMIHDHLQLAHNMQPFVQKMGVTSGNRLTAEHEALYLKLKVLSGDTFDKEYVKTMVDDHKEDLEKFTAEYDSTSYAPLKKVVGGGKTVIAEHKEMIDGLASKMGA